MRLRSLLEPGPPVTIPAGRVVLWLDDLEPFLNQGVTFQTLREWRAGGPGRIVAATYGGKGSELIADSAAGGLSTIADDVLQHAREIPLLPTSSDELEPLRGRLSDTEFEAVCRCGLAAYLVAGPRLERKLTTARHSPAEAACPQGVAVVHAAIDWARCGRTDPIGDDTLRTLWPAYLPAGMDPSDDGFGIGVDWALRPVAATIALRAAQTSRYYPALVLIAATGLRKGEALALSWDHSIVNLDEGWLKVRKTVGRIGTALEFSEPKTDRSRRTVPLSPAVVAMLRKHRTEQKAERLRAGDQWQETGLVFTTEFGTPVDPRNFLRVIEDAAKAAGVDGVGVHTLRHSAAVGWLEAGVHIKAVADMLGHSSISITGDIYGHTSDETARSAVDGWSGALGL